MIINFCWQTLATPNGQILSKLMLLLMRSQERFAIHHQPDNLKQEIYRSIYQLLKPGGIFLNLEHVSSATKWVGELQDDLFIDYLYQFQQQKGNDQSREQVAQEYYYRPDKAANILAPVEIQCHWLRELGFQNVDCYFKLFEIALFGGSRPES